MTPERKEEIKQMVEDDDVTPFGTEYIIELLAALEEAQQQAEKHRKVAEAKILFTNQGNNDYVYGLQEDLVEAQQTIARQQGVLKKLAYDVSGIISTRENPVKVLNWAKGAENTLVIALRGETQP